MTYRVILSYDSGIYFPRNELAFRSEEIRPLIDDINAIARPYRMSVGSVGSKLEGFWKTRNRLTDLSLNTEDLETAFNFLRDICKFDAEKRKVADGFEIKGRF